jgi:hypothetical protein
MVVLLQDHLFVYLLGVIVLLTWQPLTSVCPLQPSLSCAFHLSSNSGLVTLERVSLLAISLDYHPLLF